MVGPIDTLIPVVGAGRALIGLDVGTKTLGVAAGDRTGMIATPLNTIRRTRFGQDVEALRQLIRSREPGGIVIGLPINMDGSEGPRCQSTRRFADDLAGRLDLPIALWDERWSTQAVSRAMIEADVTRQRRALQVDRAAAAWILQGALDRLARLRAIAGASS